MIRRKEQGFVSIIVAATIMIILALLTIGFTRIMQREQRQSLDRQLSRQALYAAESGVNEVYEKLVTEPTLAENKTTCDTDDSSGSGLVVDHVLDSANQVEYTCILYDKTPGALEYTISDVESKIVRLTNAGGGNFSEITVNWGSENAAENDIASLPDCTVADVFPGSRTNVPLLKLDLTSLANFSRNSLINNTDYLYFSPCKNGVGSATHAFGNGSEGSIVPVNCSGGSGNRPCSVTVANLNTNDYLARFKPVYGSANATVEGLDGFGNSVNFVGQYNIDITAKANDVVRRLRASISAVEVDNPPETVLQAFDGVCKRIEISGSGPVDNCP